MKAVDLPQTAADPVSHHSASHLSRYGKAKPVLPSSVTPYIEGNPTIRRGFSPLIQPAKQVIFLQRHRFFHRNTPFIRVSSGCCGNGHRGEGILPRPRLFLFIPMFPPSVSQAGAALHTTASQNLAAVGGGHALTEAVDLGAVTLLGLIGTNHTETPPA